MRYPAAREAKRGSVFAYTAVREPTQRHRRVRFILADETHQVSRLPVSRLDRSACNTLCHEDKKVSTVARENGPGDDV